MKLALFVAIACVGLAYANPIDVHSLIAQAQEIYRKATDFIEYQVQEGNGRFLQVLERDATAVKAMIDDLMGHEHGQVLSAERIAAIETGLKQYEARIEQDINNVKRQIGEHHETSTVPVTEPTHITETQTTPSAEHSTVTEPVTQESTTSFPLPTPPEPNDNLITAAEDLLQFTAEFLVHYKGQYREEIEKRIKLINETLAIAKDPTNPSDKFMTAVVLGNQLKMLRELLYKAAGH